MKPLMFIPLALALYLAPVDSDAANDSENGANTAFAEGLEAYDGGDYETARSRWQDSVTLGHVDAMTALADLLMRGHGGSVDYPRAIALYHKAARLGDATASLTLGILALGDEETLIQDYLMAYVWFSISARQGSQWAKNKALILRKKLTEPEHAMATKMIEKKLLLDR